MTSYGLFNVVLALAAFSAAAVLFPQPKLQHARTAGRVALLITIFAYPWDFFAVRLGVWLYPVEPGVMLYGVPVNDLVFMWLCSYFGASFLMWSDRRRTGSESNAEGEGTSN